MISYPQNEGTESEMLWKFKNNENSTETAKKNCSAYGPGILTDFKVRN